MPALSGASSPLIGHNGGPPLPKPRNNLLAAIGDSRIAYGGNNIPSTASNLANSFMLWAMRWSGWRCAYADGGNYGVAGNTLQQIQARVAAMVAATPAAGVVLLGGVNNAGDDITVTGPIYEQILSALQASPTIDVIFLLNEYPKNGMVSPTLDYQLGRHNFLSSPTIRQRYPKVVVVDVYTSLWDQTTAANFLPGYSIDDRHLDMPGSVACGKALGAVLAQVYGDYRPMVRLPTVSGQAYNASSRPDGYLLDNYLLSGGTSSAAPTNWAVNVGSLQGATASYVYNGTDPDGFPEVAITVSGTTTAAASLIFYLNNTAAAAYAAALADGDRAYSLARVRVDAGATGFLGPGISLSLGYTPSGGSATTVQAYNFRGVAQLYPNGADDPLMSPLVTAPTGWTAGSAKKIIPSLNLAFAQGAMQATVRVSRFGALPLRA